MFFVGSWGVSRLKRLCSAARRLRGACVNGSSRNFRPCLDVRFTENRPCMIDRGARYKVYATIHTSQLSTPLRQEHRATRRFLEATPMKEVTFQRARESARGAVLGVRVAFGTVSTTEHRSPNGDARGKSRAKVLVDPPAAPICNRCRLCSGRGPRSRSQL